MIDRDKLIERLRGLLGADEAKKYGLTMIEDDVHQEDEWWHVPVVSGIPNVNAFDYAPILNRIEEDFENQGTKLLLIPDVTD